MPPGQAASRKTTAFHSTAGQQSTRNPYRSGHIRRSSSQLVLALLDYAGENLKSSIQDDSNVNVFRAGLSFRPSFDTSHGASA